MTCFTQVNARTITINQVEDETDYDSDLEDEEEFSDDEEETLMVKSMVQAAFDRKISDNELKRFLNEDPGLEGSTSKKARLAYKKESENSGAPRKFSNVVSCDSLITIAQNFVPSNKIKPEDHLRSLIQGDVKLYPASSLKGFFKPLTEEAINAYNVEFTNALRNKNMTNLYEMMSEGHPMDCGNKFGETAVHAACRRNSDDLLKFLVEEAGASIRVVCDQGRTPLHDACWTTTPNWKLISMLLDECPDLLYITDKRGFSPLAYVRPAHWDDWCQFLSCRGTSGLLPRELLV